MKATIVRMYDHRYITVKLGFSWTTFFFGGFVPLFRGDLFWALIMFIFGVSGLLTPFGSGTFIIHFIFAFLYNRLYLNNRLKNGFAPATALDAELINRYLG